MNGFCGRFDADGLHVLRSEADVLQRSAGCSVLFGGHLADPAGVCRQLDLTGGHAFPAETIAAHAYRRWGAELQKHLDGEFAIAAHDPVSGTALLTHDALGIAPLFYVSRGPALWFATNLLDLMRLLPNQELDVDYFASYLATGYLSGAATPIRSISRLLPGMSLGWSPSGGVRLIRTWDLADAPAVRLASDRDYEEQLRELLARAVAASIGERGATWIALSGGLDSSTVACIAAADERNAELGAYSLVMPCYPPADETPWIREIADRAGMAWHPLDVSKILPFTDLPDEMLGEPSPALLNATRRRHTNALFARHGVKTVLTGDGGDAILGAFCGPIPGHLADPLFSGRPVAALRGVRRWGAEALDDRPLSYWVLRALVAPAVDHLSGRQILSDAPLPLPPWINRGYAEEMQLADRGRSRLATRCRYPGHQQTWDTIWVGSLSMAASARTLEEHVTRTPLLYRPLVEFMQGIPWEQKLRPRCDRYLQRRALKGILPERVRRRGSKAIGTWPIVEGLRRSRDWISYLCDDPRIVSLGIADREAWRGAVALAAAGQTFGDRYFLTAAAFEAWLQQLASWRSVGCDGKAALHVPASH